MTVLRRTIAFAMIALSINTLVATSVIRADTTQQIEITDPKLGTVKYALETVEYWLERMTPGDAARAKKLDRDLLRVINQFKQVKGADAGQSREMIRRIQSVTKELQAKSKPAGVAVSNAANNTAQEQPSTTNSTPSSSTPSNVASTRPSSANEDPSVTIQRLQDKYHKIVLVPELTFETELKSEQVDEFISQMHRLRTEISKDLPLVQELANSTRRANYLLNLLETETEKKLDRNIDIAIRLIESKVRFVASYLDKQANLDPHENRYVLSDEQRREKATEQFESMARSIEQGLRFQNAVGRSNELTQIKASYDANLKKWRAIVGSSILIRELPRDIADPRLAKIASDVLGRKKYGVGKVERLIVNAKVRPGERIQYEIFNGKLETIVRKWDEYQVATVEQEDGKYFVYYNTLRKFSRAPRTTPIDQWILAKRFKSGEVAAEMLE